MTPQQFKEKYPQYNKLEDNQLWNTMEDVLGKLPKYQVSHEVKDWKGNILKPGDEFCYIRVINRQGMSFAGFIMFNEDGTTTIDTTHVEPKREDQPCWEVSEYHRVDNKEYYYIKTSFGTISSHISMINFDLMGIETTILAIKGISDNKEEYEQYKIRL